MAYTAPSQVPYAGNLTTVGSAGRPLPVTQFIQDTVGSSGLVTAPPAGTPFCQIAGTTLPQGGYAISVTVCFLGSTAETTGNNVVLKIGGTTITRLVHPTSVSTPITHTVILTLTGLAGDDLRLEAVSNATASTSYAGQLLCTRIK